MRWLRIFVTLSLIAGAAEAQVSTGLIAAPRDRYEAIGDAYQPFAGRALPMAVDLSDRFPPPGNQGNQQSCVGWAVAYAMKSFHERVERGWSLRDPAGGLELSRVFSPSFVYNQINRGVDRGSNFGDAFRVLAVQGAAPLSAMPYTGSPFVAPSAAARQAAGDFRIDTFRTVDLRNRDELKSQLNAGYPIIFAAVVDYRFQTWSGAQTLGGASGPVLGRHAMVVVGYDDMRGAYRVMNSWGSQWGDRGYAWVSYDRFEAMGTEAYIVFDQKGYSADDAPRDIPADVWTPPSIPAERSSLIVESANPNWIDPMLGIGLRVTGTLAIPPSVQGTAQVVISLNFAGVNIPVVSPDPRFSTPGGQAAFGTPPVRLNGTGFETRWYAFIRYCSLNLPMGTYCVPNPTGFLARSDLIATPVLYVDGFGVAEGQPLPFSLLL